MSVIWGNAAVRLRDARIVSTCKPCSGATPFGNTRAASRSYTRHWPPGVTPVGATATICAVQGATSATARSVGAGEDRYADPLAAATTKDAGARTAAFTTDEFRR